MGNRTKRTSAAAATGGVWLTATVAVTLVAADAATTWLLLTHGGPTLREADPIVAGILARWGWPAFFAADAARAAVVVVGMLLLAAVTKRRPLLRVVLLVAVLGLLLYPVAANVSMLLRVVR